jgi:hypothetical protein
MTLTSMLASTSKSTSIEGLLLDEYPIDFLQLRLIRCVKERATNYEGKWIL